MKKQSGFSVVIAVVIFALVIGGLAFGLKTYFMKEPVLTISNTNQVVTNTTTNTTVNTNTTGNINTTNTNTADTNVSMPQTGSETRSIDDTWDEYTNNDLGFSIRIPKQAWFGYAGCEWRTNSYRPTNGIVSVNTFEGDGSVYIAQEYFYQLSGESVVNDTRYYSACNKVENTFEILDQENRTWQILTAQVATTTELGDFINANFGTGGCSLGAQTESEFQAGVYDVAIQSDGLDPEQSRCFVNYGVVIKYYPAKNIVVTWDLGQDVSFARVDLSKPVADTSISNVYDGEMTNSFRFINQ